MKKKTIRDVKFADHIKRLNKAEFAERMKNILTADEIEHYAAALKLQGPVFKADKDAREAK